MTLTASKITELEQKLPPIVCDPYTDDDDGPVAGEKEEKYYELINLELDSDPLFSLDVTDDDGNEFGDYPHSTWPSNHLEDVHGRQILTIRCDEVTYVMFDPVSEEALDAALRIVNGSTQQA